MLLVMVEIQVKPDHRATFEAATARNARHSRREPGIARFDFIRQSDDPCRYVLLEVYRDPGAIAAHKETEHYRTWRDEVADLMATPRQSRKYETLDPADDGW